MGSLNYNQRHNSFSNNSNLQEFVKCALRVSYTYICACTLKLELGISANIEGVLQISTLLAKEVSDMKNLFPYGWLQSKSVT